MNKSFLISGESIDSRLDRWLRRNICEIPQSLIEKNLRKGDIKVNNKKFDHPLEVCKNFSFFYY